MKNVLTIIKKEFSRFFKDRRMVLSIFLPGIMIFVVYSLMGSFMNDMMSVDEDYKPTACIINAPEKINDAYINVAFRLAFDVKEGDEAAAKQQIQDGELDILVVFPADFSSEMASGKAPDVHIFYNSSVDTSSLGYSLAAGILESANRPEFTINSTLGTAFDLAEEEDLAKVLLAIMIPMIVFAFLASAGMSVAPESIAGEKERGTMATMLITPVRRWQLALGKIVSLACFALLSGISSFLGLILSLPKLTAGMIDSSSAIIYGFGDYIALFGVIISIVLVIIALFSVLSCYAKSVKEASSLIAPFMIVIILMGMASIIFRGTPSTPLFLIPLMGSGLAMSGIMSQTATAVQIVLSICSNLVIAALLIVLLGFMFNSERVMFKK